MTRVVSSRSKSSKTEKAVKKRASRRDAPAEQDIRILAYDLYERRKADGTEGSDITDWMEAERQLFGDANAIQDE
jgi:hypothetical protein